MIGTHSINILSVTWFNGWTLIYQWHDNVYLTIKLKMEGPLIVKENGEDFLGWLRRIPKEMGYVFENINYENTIRNNIIKQWKQWWSCSFNYKDNVWSTN